RRRHMRSKRDWSSDVCSSDLHSALGSVGVQWERELIEHGDFSYEDGQLGAERLLRLPEPPTAIFAVADTLAVGALRAARQLDVEVPEQLSVVSFDDTMIAQWTHPQLTAVDRKSGV